MTGRKPSAPSNPDLSGNAADDGDLPLQLDREALDRFYSLAYGELKRLARAVRGPARDDTLTTTGLVNDAWLKLARSQGITVDNALHFKRLVVRAMRQLLVEAARRRRSAKRGGGLPATLTLRDDLATGLEPDEYVLALDAALHRFAREYPRQSRTVEMRYFGGFGTVETAQLMSVSVATVERDCRFARAWLGAEVRAST
jgi:RNA polymerase sigma factor (TIGR02999 family)